MTHLSQSYNLITLRRCHKVSFVEHFKMSSLNFHIQNKEGSNKSWVVTPRELHTLNKCNLKRSWYRNFYYVTDIVLLRFGVLWWIDLVDYRIYNYDKESVVVYLFFAPNEIDFFKCNNWNLADDEIWSRAISDLYVTKIEDVFVFYV